MKSKFSRMRSVIMAFAPIVLGSLAAPASSQEFDRGWFVRTGPLGVVFDSGATVSVGGGVVPGGNATADDNLTLSFDVGYQFNDRFSVMLTGGIPPTADLHGQGSLYGAGYLGSATYAPSVLAGQYWFETGNPKFRPYIGVGVNYTIILDTDDGAIGGLKVDNAWAPVLQAGVESAINDKLGVYFDVKKLWLDTKAIGTVGGVAASADVTLDPWLIGAGISYRF